MSGARGSRNGAGRRKHDWSPADEDGVRGCRREGCTAQVRPHPAKRTFVEFRASNLREWREYGERIVPACGAPARI